jgi:hypothetical protein
MGAIGFTKALQRKIGKRTTLSYRVKRVKGQGWTAEIIGPFHHKFYGTCAMGSSEKLATERLKETLLSEGWLGRITLSDVDEADADKVGVRKPLSASMRAADVIGQM